MNKCTRCGTQFEPDGVCQSSLCDPCKYAVNPPAGVNRTNPITIAREQGRKAGLDPKMNLGLNPHVKGREPALWEAWRQGYKETCPQFTVQTKAKFDGIPYGGRELE